MDSPTPVSLSARLWRAFKWTVINLAVAALAYYGAVHGVVGAARVFVFITWVSAILWVLASLIEAGDKDLVKMQQRGFSVPTWVRGSCDALLIGFLVWHGWWGSVIGMILGVMFSYHVMVTKAAARS